MWEWVELHRRGRLLLSWQHLSHRIYINIRAWATSSPPIISCVGILCTHLNHHTAKYVLKGWPRSSERRNECFSKASALIPKITKNHQNFGRIDGNKQRTTCIHHSLILNSSPVCPSPMFPPSTLQSWATCDAESRRWFENCLNYPQRVTKQKFTCRKEPSAFSRFL